MIVIIDNYDSFTYNIYQYVRSLTDLPVTVIRNDQITIDAIKKLQPTKIIISPGPGRPKDAGISIGVVRAFAKTVDVLGVCLGHQVIAAAFGAEIIPAQHIVHGKIETIQLDGRGLFRLLNKEVTCTRYHSLAVDARTLPSEFEITARARDGEIMGIRHRTHRIEGVQFHPESIGTTWGREMIKNFLHYKREPLPVSAYITKIQHQNDLTHDEAAQFMDELTDGTLDDAQIAAFLVGINSKKISASEIAGCASVLRKKCAPFPKQRMRNNFLALDTCGTGGDGLGTFNISSLTAIICAACGAPVAKHGNRAVSSRSGSAEFYSALGIPIQLTPQQAQLLLAKSGFTFLFAPIYHSAMRFAAPARKSLGVKTIMNTLGPLLNPAHVDAQLVGVFSKRLCTTMAEAARTLGIKRALFVHAHDGQDEISVTGKTDTVLLQADGSLTEGEIDPAAYGFKLHALADLIGGDVNENVALANALLAGKGRAALQDAVILNSAAALSVSNDSLSIPEAIDLCRNALQSGAAAQKLQEIIKVGKAWAH